MRAFKKITPNIDSLCKEAASQLLRLIHQGVDAKGDFHLFLAGGSTPQGLYKLLATNTYASAIPWGNVHIYFGDERNVAPDHRDSNYNMVNKALLSHINIDPTHIHRIHGELEAHEAATAYDATLNHLLPEDSEKRLQPDLVILGLGDDGHIASLFPDTDVLDVTDRSCSAVWVAKLKTWRISITYPLINNARHLWLFVAGESKREIVERVFNHPSNTGHLPVQRIAARGEVTWFLDQAAAGSLL